MNFNRKEKRILLGSILIIPMFMAFYAYLGYVKSPARKMLAQQNDSQVAGAQSDENKPFADDLSKDIPIMPNSEISSINKYNDSITVVISSGFREPEIKSFYEDYFFKNNWKEIQPGIYEKNYKKITIEYSENIVKATIEKSLKTNL